MKIGKYLCFPVYGNKYVACCALEAPLESRNHQINIDQVNAEAQELRRLVDGLPLQIDQVTKGQMPKDLAENLKRIEKLAKHLRSEITP